MLSAVEFCDSSFAIMVSKAPSGPSGSQELRAHHTAPGPHGTHPPSHCAAGFHGCQPSFHFSAAGLFHPAPNLTRMYSRMHASTTHCNSCARMLLSPAQLLACARGRRRRSAAPALAYSSARPWRARHGCSISGQKQILHARMHAPPTQCSSCARMLLRTTQLFACLHTHACAAAALQLLRFLNPNLPTLATVVCF